MEEDAMEVDTGKEDFVAREYQIELFEKALDENIIIYLPTGCGKTFIATMLIKHKSADILAKYSEGGKRSFFLVNTVTLAHQQAQSIQKHVPFSVGTYTGDMGVDFWQEERWHQELDKNQILVMTAQIFLDMLRHCYVFMKQVNLIVMDECHHAVKQHSMKQIMELYHTESADHRPRILGLTATLLNSNIRLCEISKEIHELEVTLHAKICRAKNENMIKSFSANPQEFVILYDKTKPDECFVIIDKTIEKLIGCLSDVKPEEEKKIVVDLGDGLEIFPDRKSEQKKVKNMLNDISVISEENGSFAASYGILARIFNLERLKLSTSDMVLNNVYCMCTTILHSVRKSIRTIMGAYSPVDRLIKFSTPKLLKLFDILKDFPEDSSAIIFVTRRVTAQSLYYVFKILSSQDINFKSVKPDFIVGCNTNTFNNTREPELVRKSNKETMERFNKRVTNVLFASDVIEEGIDIRHCNYVIKYDEPKTFCSYVQSKGRARHKESHFIIFASKEEKKPFSTQHMLYKEAQKQLTEELRYNKSERRLGGTEREANFIFETPRGCEPFYVDGPGSAVVSLGSAIALLNRYCTMLPSDNFTSLTVTYWKKITKNNKIAVSLRLPMNSPLKEIIEGVPCDDSDTAKASAALEACKKLFHLKELNSKLLPVGFKVEVDEKDAFPMWEEEADHISEGEFNNGKPGTKKNIRIYDREIPRWMCGCTPKPNCDTYIHLIRITPTYECPNTNRHKTFRNLILSPNTFALLTSNKWPKVCEFPMFMNVGEVNIKIEENYKVKVFSEGELKEIFDFHCLLVTQALPMRKKFLVKDFDNGKHSYYIAPCLDINNTVIIDWKTIKEHKKIPSPVPLSDKARSSIVVTKDKYNCKIVIPWYRPVGMQLRYIVTNVCEDMTPLSPFPSESYTSYSHYFSARYEKSVHPNQYLIEVRAISQKHNCLLPRDKSRLGKRKRRDEEDLEEILIPELCCLLEFPAVYLLKVTLIPSIMHRLSLLFLAEELRLKIASEVGLGIVSLPPGFVWDRLKADETVLNLEEDRPNQLKSTIEVSNMLTSKMENLNPSDCPWNKEDEPCDIDRNLLTADLISIRHYHNFVRMKLNVGENMNSSSSQGKHGTGRGGIGYSWMSDNIVVPEIPFLHSVKNSTGPQLCELIQVLVSNSGNDIINYERLETLGDSFLKFISCLVLFTNFPDMDEGKLTYLKGKIVGNRNLFYCGRNIKLGSMLKVTSFIADDWDVPHYKLLDVIKSLMKELNISAEFLFTPSLSFSQEESDTSVLEEETYNRLMEFLSKAVGRESSSHGPIHLLQQEAVSDKYVSDSLEALIGVYLKTCGIEGAFRLCQWLKICKWMPKDDIDLRRVLYQPAPSAYLNPTINMDRMLVAPELLEAKLGYQFKDRSFLLQALSHSSYAQYATDCYQRLEFLGDAILDFLITCHIYNSFHNLGPGELTDLRSSLVNNVTFACLTVRYGFHNFLLIKSMELSKMINKFAEIQAKRHHKIGAEVFLLVNESDVQVGQLADVPKILGDMFESLAGAIYLDSGKSLETVWKVFYRLMHNEIKEFSANVPKNNIRLLYEKFPNPLPVFKKVNNDKPRYQLVKVFVTHNGEMKAFYGVGENKAIAKMAAAKIALRHYHETVHSL